jgi:hypothetical protein
MIKAYNFLGSWQLFPKKGTYESGERPKSGIYKIETTDSKKELIISHSWTSLENKGFSSVFRVKVDAELQAYEDHGFADQVQVSFIDSISFETHFYRSGIG